MIRVLLLDADAAKYVPLAKSKAMSMRAAGRRFANQTLLVDGYTAEIQLRGDVTIIKIGGGRPWVIGWQFTPCDNGNWYQGYVSDGSGGRTPLDWGSPPLSTWDGSTGDGIDWNALSNPKVSLTPLGKVKNASREESTPRFWTNHLKNGKRQQLLIGYNSVIYKQRSCTVGVQPDGAAVAGGWVTFIAADGAYAVPLSAALAGGDATPVSVGVVGVAADSSPLVWNFSPSGLSAVALESSDLHKYNPALGEFADYTDAKQNSWEGIQRIHRAKFIPIPKDPENPGDPNYKPFRVDYTFETRTDALIRAVPSSPALVINELRRDYKFDKFEIYQCEWLGFTHVSRYGTCTTSPVIHPSVVHPRWFPGIPHDINIVADPRVAALPPALPGHTTNTITVQGWGAADVLGRDLDPPTYGNFDVISTTSLDPADGGDEYMYSLTVRFPGALYDMRYGEIKLSDLLTAWRPFIAARAMASLDMCEAYVAGMPPWSSVETMVAETRAPQGSAAPIAIFETPLWGDEPSVWDMGSGLLTCGNLFSETSEVGSIDITNVSMRYAPKFTNDVYTDISHTTTCNYTGRRVLSVDFKPDGSEVLLELVGDEAKKVTMVRTYKDHSSGRTDGVGEWVYNTTISGSMEYTLQMDGVTIATSSVTPNATYEEAAQLLDGSTPVPAIPNIGSVVNQSFEVLGSDIRFGHVLSLSNTSTLSVLGGAPPAVEATGKLAMFAGGKETALFEFTSAKADIPYWGEWQPDADQIAVLKLAATAGCVGDDKAYGRVPLLRNAYGAYVRTPKRVLVGGVEFPTLTSTVPLATYRQMVGVAVKNTMPADKRNEEPDLFDVYASKDNANWYSPRRVDRVIDSSYECLVRPGSCLWNSTDPEELYPVLVSLSADAWMVLATVDPRDETNWTTKQRGWVRFAPKKKAAGGAAPPAQEVTDMGVLFGYVDQATAKFRNLGVIA